MDRDRYGAHQHSFGLFSAMDSCVGGNYMQVNACLISNFFRLSPFFLYGMRQVGASFVVAQRAMSGKSGQKRTGRLGNTGGLPPPVDVGYVLFFFLRACVVCVFFLVLPPPVSYHGVDLLLAVLSFTVVCNPLLAFTTRSLF